jgi:hypothetical protein
MYSLTSMHSTELRGRRPTFSGGSWLLLESCQPPEHLNCDEAGGTAVSPAPSGGEQADESPSDAPAAAGQAYITAPACALSVPTFLLALLLALLFYSRTCWFKTFAVMWWLIVWCLHWPCIWLKELARS